MSSFILLLLIPAVLATFSACHALLNKRDPRAALGWIGICLTFPIAGPLLYFVFGINRVKRSAMRLREQTDSQREVAKPLLAKAAYQQSQLHPDYLETTLEPVHVPPRYHHLERVGRALSSMPLTGGNCVHTLFNGEQTYPHMLRAIRNASHTVLLCTYIMDTGTVGREFIEALREAVERGVDVRVIIDGIGEKYSWPNASSLLRKAGVPVARFLPPRMWRPQFSINLRNHRKILVVDGRIAFTGGMNIGKRHMTTSQSSSRISDIHFMINGPLAIQLQETFIADWEFATGEFTPPPPPENDWAGDTLGRVILNGPDEDIDRLPTILNGIISSASRSIRIMTPYFLPNRELIASLKAAALRGVEVIIILPQKNNLPFVHWATRNILPELLESNIKVFYQPPPFCHTKLLIIDGAYVHLGSANMDPRSLYLNFELTVEIFDIGQARALSKHFDTIRHQSHSIYLDELRSKSLLPRMRNAFFWLFSPYL